MAELRESSMLFSLKRRRDTGAERSDVSAERGQRRLEAELQARAEREQLQREAERHRVIEIERRRARQLMEEREETARLAALKQAELERARAEAGARARLELVQRQQQHERTINDLTQQMRLGRVRVLLVATSGFFLLTVVVGAAVYFGRVQPHHQQMQKAYRELVGVARQRADYTERLIQDVEQRNRKLHLQVDRLRKELDEARGQCHSSQGPRAVRPRNAAAARAKPPPSQVQPRARRCRHDGDPFSPCLG